MKTVIKYLLILLLLAIGGFAFYNKVYIPKTTYDRVKTHKGDLDVEVYGIGNVGANHIYKITSQVAGKVLSISTDEGKWVKKGEVLVTIDTVDIPQLLEGAKISVKKARSELVAAKEEKDRLLSQQALSEVTYRRYYKLKQQAYISNAEFDKVKTDLDSIKAQVASSQAHIETAKIEIARAVKSVEGLEEKLQRYQIYAPADGYVIARRVEVAQSVQPAQTILEIVDPASVWVKTYIDEKISGRIQVGQKATIKLRSSSEELGGKVARIVSQSDAVTQEREVDVAFDKLPIPFYINEQAEVKIAAQHYSDVVKVSAKALTYYNEKRGVWVSKDGKAHFVPVQIVARGEKEVAIAGIDAGTELLLASEKNKPLKEGASIR